jgi:hypothetical protein
VLDLSTNAPLAGVNLKVIESIIVDDLSVHDDGVIVLA